MEIIEGINNKFIKKIVTEAGNILKEGFYKSDKDVRKKENRELVTKYDYKSEAYLKKKLDKFGYDIIAEESEKTNISTEYWWVIDPLDGTNNFSFNIPHFCVTVALFKNKEVVFGIIYDPIKEETFYAVKNMGAYLNDNIITVSSNNKLSESMVATGFAYDRDKSGNNNLDNFKRLALNAKGIRRMGAAALDLAYVASGRFDGFWESGLKLWDMAAGKLLVEEAGGEITDLGNREWKISEDNIVASNNLIHDELTKHLRGI